MTIRSTNETVSAELVKIMVGSLSEKRSKRGLATLRCGRYAAETADSGS